MSKQSQAMLRLLPVAALLVTSSPASAAPLQPTGKWIVDYSASSCRAIRTYGEHTLVIEPAPLGKATRIMVTVPGQPTFGKQVLSTIQPADGGPPIKTTSLFHSLGDRAALRTVLPNDSAARLMGSTGFKFDATSPASLRKHLGTRVRKAGQKWSFEFALRSMPQMSQALSKCVDDLQAFWGMVDGKLPEPAKKAQIVKPLGSLITPDDYPDDALRANQSGKVLMMLMLDEQGRILDCVVQETSGIASLDAMSCNIAVERATFVPAQDANGKAVRSTYVATITWQVI